MTHPTPTPTPPSPDWMLVSTFKHLTGCLITIHSDTSSPLGSMLHKYLIYYLSNLCSWFACTQCTLQVLTLWYIIHTIIKVASDLRTRQCLNAHCSSLVDKVQSLGFNYMHRQKEPPNIHWAGTKIRPHKKPETDNIKLKKKKKKNLLRLHQAFSRI